MSYAKEIQVTVERPRQGSEYRILAAEDSLIGLQCLICDAEFAVDDDVVSIVLGPGGDATRRSGCSRAVHEAVHAFVHRACALGE